MRTVHMEYAYLTDWDQNLRRVLHDYPKSYLYLTLTDKTASFLRLGLVDLHL
jgi:hypothetical protein